jgi:hypothetical protein
MGECYACFDPFLVLTRVFRLHTRPGGKRDDEDSSDGGGGGGGGHGSRGVDVPRECRGITRGGRRPAGAHGARCAGNAGGARQCPHTGVLPIPGYRNVSRRAARGRGAPPPASPAPAVRTSSPTLPTNPASVFRPGWWHPESLRPMRSLRCGSSMTAGPGNAAALGRWRSHGRVLVHSRVRRAVQTCVSTESHGDRDHRDSRVPACSWTRRESTHQPGDH